MHKVITIQEAEILLSKYYEGFTSVKEEKLLHTFLSQKNLPEKFEADKAMLGYFVAQKKKETVSKVVLNANDANDTNLRKNNITYNQRHKKMIRENLRHLRSFKTVPLFWKSIAAAVIIGIMIVHLLMPGKTNSYAYINGKKITNIEQIKGQALASIHSWNHSDNDTNVDTDELIIQQLQLFVK